MPKPHARLVHVSHSRSRVAEHEPRWYWSVPHAGEHVRQLVWPVAFWYVSPPKQSVFTPLTHFAPVGQGNAIPAWQ